MEMQKRQVKLLLQKTWSDSMHRSFHYVIHTKGGKQGTHAGLFRHKEWTNCDGTLEQRWKWTSGFVQGNQGKGKHAVSDEARNQKGISRDP